jgi:copper chaperone CopZ
METKTYIVPNISCKHCTHTIGMELSDLEGVKSVEADVQSKQVKVTFEAPANDQLIKNTLAEINYPAES